MKTFYYYGFLLLSISLAITSCTLEKRRYSAGYHMNWRSSQAANEIDDSKTETREVQHSVANEPAAQQVTDIAADEELAYVSTEPVVEDLNTVITYPPVKKNPGALREFGNGFISGATETVKFMYDDEPEPRNHGLAVTSMILGILSLVTLYGAFLFGVLAIIFGAVALGAIKRDSEKYKGRGMARAGLICGIISVAIILIYISVVL